MFPLAEQLRSGPGVRLGDLFTFVSGLYFRGKLTYARRFASSPEADNPIVGHGIHVMTPNAGLRAPETLVTAPAVRAFARGDIDPGNRSYCRPLRESARRLAGEIGSDCDVILLGSIASPKYVDVLGDIFGSRLKFPIAFVGRGDMSRGGLLLRSAAAGAELEYAVVAEAVRHGSRPPKLPPLRTARLSTPSGRSKDLPY